MYIYAVLGIIYHPYLLKQYPISKYILTYQENILAFCHLYFFQSKSLSAYRLQQTPEQRHWRPPLSTFQVLLWVFQSLVVHLHLHIELNLQSYKNEDMRILFCQ